MKPKRKMAKPSKLLTNSMRTCFIKCRRRFWYSYDNKLTPKERAIYFVIGSAFHTALDSLYTKAKLPKVLKAADDEMREAMTVTVSPFMQEKLETGRAMLRGMLRAYFQTYIASDLKRFEVLHTEVKGEMTASSDPEWIWGGKLDMVVQEKATKQVFIMEHKTAASINEDYVGRLPLDDQIHHYHILAEKFLFIRLNHVIWDM